MYGQTSKGKYLGLCCHWFSMPLSKYVRAVENMRKAIYDVVDLEVTHKLNYLFTIERIY